MNCFALEKTRAWGMPGARCTRSLICKKVKAYERRHREVHRFHPAFPHAMVLTVSSVIFPVIGFVVTVASGILPARLTPASRRQNHTTSPSASHAVRQQHVRVHRIPSCVRDDRERPLVGRDGAGYGFDLGEKRTNIFLQSELDRRFPRTPVGQIRRLRYLLSYSAEAEYPVRRSLSIDH